MKRLLPVLAVLAVPCAAWAGDAAPLGCGLASGLLVNQEAGTVTIACTGASPDFGVQLAGLLTQVLQRRLDPGAVAAKLDEIAPMAKPGVARELDARQREAIIASLVGKAPGKITIMVDPTVGDAVGYGTSIATPLTMVGWEIVGRQITRKASPALEAVRGIAVAVRDPAAPPDPARLLREALSAGRVPTPFVADPSLAADATVLWVGRRPDAPAPPKS